MPNITAIIEYLQKLELYDIEKPYYCLLRPQEGYDPNAQRLDNLEFEFHHDIVITDMRGSDPDISECGFQVLQHESSALPLDSEEQAAKYISETESLLKQTFGAVFTKCYEIRQRRNVRFERTQMNYNDLLLVEGPARGAHSDVTYRSGPDLIKRYLSEDEKLKYLRPGYRVRIMNTWRGLTDVVEDRPLALCDYRSVEPQDLVAADRVVPGREGEVYYLTYNPKHRWHWLEKQTPKEPFVFVMYDTKSGPHARFCPHVSFDNSRKSEDAPARYSVETRSVVITAE